MKRLVHLLIALVAFGLIGIHTPEASAQKIEVLFLGHDSQHHNSAAYMPLLASALSKSGINLTYTSDPNDLNPETLGLYDALMLYANHDSITPEQNTALLDFVAGGKGFLPIHSASYCFRNSPEFVALVGAQFKEHGTGTFTVPILEPDHPVMQGLAPFETWDETYIHDFHNPDRIVLMERVEGDHREPWTWVRTHGNGRIFYTAYGHDERTWSHPGFHTLIQSAVLWAVGDEVRGEWEQLTLEPHVYTEAKLPNYEQRDPPPKLQAPFSPEASQQYIQVPPEFELQLFAAEPDILNPIALNWDERGRLWVIETRDYPNNMQPQEEGNDAIKILEDTDGDGRADRITVFADKLTIPTSFVFANGGIIVAQAPHFLFLKDTNGDDRADVREVIMTGWGISDTHAGPSNLRYGFDNWIWGTVGYADFDGVVGGQDTFFAQGIYRFRPDGSEMEFVTPFTNNTWGLGFSETFDIFGSTANNTHSVYVGIPNRYYEGVAGLSGPGRKKIDGHYAMHTNTVNVRQVDVFGGFTSAAGHSLYTARSYPKSYWNRVALVTEPTGHLLHRAILEPNGAGFVEKDGWNLLASADEWVSPVHADVGPDGAVWVADWYNFIVQHNPTPEGFETGKGNAHINPYRDKEHGRIYRIVYKQAPPFQGMHLSKDQPQELVAALKNDNLFWRLTAQRLLVERGRMDVLPDLYALLNDTSTDELGLNGAALHALWTLHGLNALDGRNPEAEMVVQKALNHPAGGVRKAAFQALPSTTATTDAILGTESLQDPDLHTRLAALLKASELPASEALGEAVYEAGKDTLVSRDEWLAEALMIAASAHKTGYINAYIADIGSEAFTDVLAQQAEMRSVGSIDWAPTNLDESDWGTIPLPIAWELAGLEDLEDLDGIVWFRKTITLPAGMNNIGATLSLGPIDDADETWVNGVRVGGMEQAWSRPRVYDIPDGVLKAGENVIAIRAQDDRGRGGVWGEAEQMYLEAGPVRMSLAGAWRYKIEHRHESDRRSPLRLNEPLAEQFVAFNVVSDALEEQKGQAEASIEDGLMVVPIKAIAGALQFDRTTFTVKAGQRVQIVFDNPDDMQHNLLILKPGTLEAIGAQADAMMTEPDAADKHYIPESPDVLFATNLVDPRGQAVLTFTAPSEPGTYPFVCTFPGHWRIMQGVMTVER